MKLEKAIEEKLFEKGFDKGSPNYYNLIRETTFKYIANKIALEEHIFLDGKAVNEAANKSVESNASNKVKSKEENYISRI